MEARYLARRLASYVSGGVSEAVELRRIDFIALTAVFNFVRDALARHTGGIISRGTMKSMWQLVLHRNHPHAISVRKELRREFRHLHRTTKFDNPFINVSKKVFDRVLVYWREHNREIQRRFDDEVDALTIDDVEAQLRSLNRDGEFKVWMHHGELFMQPALKTQTKM